MQVQDAEIIAISLYESFVEAVLTTIGMSKMEVHPSDSLSIVVVLGRPRVAYFQHHVAHKSFAWDSPVINSAATHVNHES